MSTEGSMATAIGFAILAATLPCVAVAGGFDRFDQSVSLLFDPATIAFEISGGAVPAASGYSSVNNQPEKVPLTDDYLVGSLRIKITPAESLSCQFHAGRPFGTDISHGKSWSGAGIVSSQFLRVDELGLTCAKAFSASQASLRLIGGLTYDLLRFEQNAVNLASTSRLGLDSDQLGWRAGVAIEVPSTTLTASVMYYGPLSFDLRGDLRQGLDRVGLSGDVEFPQAMEAQVFLSPLQGWLIGGILKWSDWSVLDEVSLNSTTSSVFGAPGSHVLDLEAHFRDGLTVAGFVGRALDAQWSVWGRVAWDRGVSTGWTEHTESWSLFAGLKYRASESIELGGTLGLIWLTAGTIDQGPIRATFDADIAIVPQIGMTLRFNGS